MVERLKTKQDIRSEIEAAIARYVNTGGEIEEIQQGVSGRYDNVNLSQAIPLSQGQQQTRTPVNDTIKAIDERRQQKKQAATSPSQQRPKKRIIYDDFGEPIREIWE